MSGSSRDAIPAGDTQLVPSALLDPVVVYLSLRRVTLFHSLARGEARPDSDIDLLVIVDDPGEDEPGPEPSTEELLEALSAIGQRNSALRSFAPSQSGEPGAP
jgi:hypothetical protein